MMSRREFMGFIAAASAGDVVRCNASVWRSSRALRPDHQGRSRHRSLAAPERAFATSRSRKARIVAVEANIAGDAAGHDSTHAASWSCRASSTFTRIAAVRGRSGALSEGRRDGMGRCGLAGRGSHRRHDRGGEVVAAAGPRADQHRTRRHPARKATPWTSARADVTALRRTRSRAIATIVVGIKARLSRDVAGTNDFEVLDAARRSGDRTQSARDDPYGSDHHADRTG